MAALVWPFKNAASTFAAGHLFAAIRRPSIVNRQFSVYLPHARIDRLAELAYAEALEERQRFDAEREVDLLVVTETERVVDVGKAGFHAVQIANDLEVPALKLA